MKTFKTLLFGCIILVVLSCKKVYNEIPLQQENGEVWLSGGSAYCAQQIRLDNGDTLVVSLEDVVSLRSGDRINIKFKKIGENKNCHQYFDCEVIKMMKLE